jgi:hypothetical protein
MDLTEFIAVRYESPYEMYRSYYKYTACGPSLGIKVAGSEWVYCDRLRSLGTLDQMRAAGQQIEAVSVSSIIEGTDAEVPSIEVEGQFADERAFFGALDRAVDEVDKEAHAIWLDTHGCEACARHWNDDAGIESGYEAGDCPVWADCPECHGDGEVC